MTRTRLQLLNWSANSRSNSPCPKTLCASKKTQAKLLGETENYVVTREFRKYSSKEQRGELLQCLFAVAAADGTISNVESSEIAVIGEELGFTRPEINAVRSRYRDHLSEFQTRPE